MPQKCLAMFDQSSIGEERTYEFVRTHKLLEQVLSSEQILVPMAG